MLQKPLTVVEPPHTWSDTQWRDMQTADFTAQNGSLNNCSNDQSAAALKLAGGTAPKPKYKLTGIKIGGKQVALPKAATPPPPAPLPEYLTKLVLVVKKANKLLKKPLQPLPDALLTPPAALPLLTPTYREGAATSGRAMRVPPLLLPSAPRALSRPAVQADNLGVQQKGMGSVAAARTANVPETSGAVQAPADAPTDTAAPMNFLQWMQASRVAAERQRGPEQDVGRPQSPAAQETAAQAASNHQLSAAAPALSPEACVSTPPDLDPASPAGSCSAVQQAAPHEKPRGALVASLVDVAEATDAAGETSAPHQPGAPSKQKHNEASGDGTSMEAEAAPRDAHGQSESLSQSEDAAAAPPAAEAPAAVAAQLPGKQGRFSPARSKSRNYSSSSLSSSDDSSSSSESSSSDSDSSSSDHSSSLSGMPLLSGELKGSSGSKAASMSGGKRPAEDVCGPSPKRHKPASAGELAINLARLDSVREDGEIKGERALRDAHAEERERDRSGRRTPERYARGSSREERYRERSHARDTERRRDDDDHRSRRRSDEYYRMHNWKYTSRPKSRESYQERDAEDDRRRRDRTLDRGRSIEEERRRRGLERERERQEERRRRDDRERGSGRHSYDYRRRSRSRERSRSRRLPSRARSRSRGAEDHRRDRSREQRTRSPSRDRYRPSERRSRDTTPERRQDRRSAEQEARAPKESPAAEEPSQARKTQTTAPGAMAPPTATTADKAAGLTQEAAGLEPQEATAMVIDELVSVARSAHAAPETPSRAARAQPIPASISAHQAQLSERKPASIQADQGALPAPANAVKGSNSPNNLSDAARAFATALRASIESQAQEGGDTSAELHKQVASRKRLAKMFVEKGLEYERQLEALVAAGAEVEDRGKLLREMCSATSEGIMLTLKAQVHFLRWAAVGERMITQGRGLEWVAAVQDPAALVAKGMQPKHVLANEYQTFLAELQLRDTRQLFGIAKARFQRAAVGNPSEKPFLSKSLQFVELARLFAMRLEMVTAVRTNAFQAPSLKQHENGLRSVEDAHRHAQRLARQQPQLQLQQQRGAPRGGQQPSPRGFPGVAGPSKQPVDAGETFQRPSPGDSNNSETTASTPPTVQGLQQYIVGAVPAGMPGLPPLQALAKADPSAYVIPPQLARSQEVLLNSHRRFMTAYDLAASREIQLMLLTMMEDDNTATSRAAALVSAMGVDAALMDVMAVPTLGRQCLEGLRALRDSLGLSPAQSAA